MKRGASVLLVLILLLNSTIVLGEPTISLEPRQAYETNHLSLSLNISNFRNAYEIKEIQANLDGFTVLATVDYKGWTESHALSAAFWKEGSIATNVILSMFEFLVEAPLVTEAIDKQATITLVDSNSDAHTYTFPLTILNDDTPPSFSGMIPQDEGFVKEGTANQPVSLNATDPETGIANVTFHYVRCNFHENITPEDHTLQLVEYDGSYSSDIDLSNYDNEQQVCFDFTAYNNGGEKTEQSGTLTVDGVPPSVTLVSPVNGDIIGLSKNFSFFADDNLAPVMNCSIDIDGAEYMEGITAADMDVVFIPSADLAEGEHSWKTRCSDPAGWEGTSATWSYTLDKTPPTINVSKSNNSIIGPMTRLDFEARDNYQLHKVWFVYNGTETEEESVFSIDVSSWPDGPNDFTVRADDSVRNQAELNYRIIVDRTAPEVRLVAPDNSATSDVHVNFSYQTTDNYDDTMDCRIYIDDAGQDQMQAEGGIVLSQQKLLAVGEYGWNVQCVDDAGNVGTSEERTLSVVDLTGPDVIMNNPDTVLRGDLVPISLEVSDISGVGSVGATMRRPDGSSQAISLERVGDTYTASVETTVNSEIGTYNLEVYAVDTLNNSNTLTDSIELTYKYTIALDLPATVSPGGVVAASGIVTFDNGSLVPEDHVTLSLPGNVSVDAAIENSSWFRHSFNAPASEGVYEVSARVSSTANGREYTSTRSFAVVAPYVRSSSGGSGGGGHGGSNYEYDTTSGGCSADFECTAWTSCTGGKQSRVCMDMNRCSTENVKKTEQRTCTVKKEGSKNDDKDTESETIPAAFRRSVSEPEEQQIDTAREDQGAAAGIGKASGFMSAMQVSMANILFALLLMMLVIGVLYKYGWSKGDGRKRPAAIDLLGRRSDHLGLESYISNRASRRDR